MEYILPKAFCARGSISSNLKSPINSPLIISSESILICLTPSLRVEKIKNCLNGYNSFSLVYSIFLKFAIPITLSNLLPVKSKSITPLNSEILSLE